MSVKRVALKDLTVGSILADSIVSVTGKILLGKDSVLTTRHISLLDTWDVKSVLISIDVEEKVEADISLQEKAQAIHSAEYIQFVQEYDSIVANTVLSFDIIQRQKKIPVSHFKDAAGSIYSSITRNNVRVMNYLLISDHNLADVITRHSVRVAYFAGIIARQMKWSQNDIAGVAFASLLHDVGNLVNGKNQDPCVQVNIADSGRLLKETQGLSNEVILGIMQHRERIDCSGIPNGTQGNRIHPYAKIIAVADHFHNLAHGDECVNPLRILDILTREMYGAFDPDICQSLICRVRDSLLFNKIILSSGQEAEIIFFNSNNYCLPVVKTVDNQIIDLSQRRDLTISRISIPA
ncbi:MAG: metal dependent phosphohydrolase [Firmicutes bacterium]|nr:metal dependent phosphohydrolase [Bacillota bacterium]